MDTQNIVLTDRKILTVTGISSVDSFDEAQICVTVNGGLLLFIEGSGLSIKDVNLEKGTLEAEGVVTGIFYDEHVHKKSGLFSRFTKEK